MRNMEKILKQLSLLLVLAYLHLKAGNSELIAFPRDTEVLVNHSTYFNCSTSILNEQIHWYHYGVGDNRTNYVFYKGHFNQIYADRYSIAIDTVTGEYTCNLIIRSVQPGDAGRYECQDDGGLGRQSTAELIVLDSSPTCQSSMKPEGLVGPNSCGLPIDELHLSCSVSYSGNIPPILQWKMDGVDAPILKGIASDHSGKRVTINLTMNSDIEMNRALLTCSNTRSHDKLYSCTTGQVKINYAVDEPTILNITKGETITCLANASVPCTCRWFYGNDTLHPVLTTTHLGDYSCEASCTINGINCTFVARRIFVFENKASTTKTLLLAILIPAVAILLIITCVVFFSTRKGPVHQSTHSADKADNEITRSRYEMKQLAIAGDEVNNEVSRPNENPSVDTKVEMQPLLTDEAIKEVTGPNESTISRQRNQERAFA